MQQNKRIKMKARGLRKAQPHIEDFQLQNGVDNGCGLSPVQDSSRQNIFT